MSAVQRVAVVTGGSHGIGAALVGAFRERGYGVVTAARSIDPSPDPDVVTVTGDITDPAVAEQITAAARSRFGRVDSLINNAGIFIGKPFGDYTAEDYAAITSVNLTGFFNVTRQVIPMMVQQGRGHVVTLTTSLVEQPDHEQPSALAALTKGGLAAVTRSLAIEYASRGVRCNAVSLGVIRTSHQDADADAYDRLATAHPLGRVGEISDVVDGILYLEGASFVTGEILHIDGGQAAGH
jgi:NAD(P)-dependent dehydrogenase (short-subunit alcohol dehydrogenase family)